MSLYNVNVEKSKRSLEVRNEVIEMIKLNMEGYK